MSESTPPRTRGGLPPGAWDKRCSSTLRRSRRDVRLPQPRSPAPSGASSKRRSSRTSEPVTRCPTPASPNNRADQGLPRNPRSADSIAPSHALGFSKAHLVEHQTRTSLTRRVRIGRGRPLPRGYRRVALRAFGASHRVAVAGPSCQVSATSSPGNRDGSDVERSASGELAPVVFIMLARVVVNVGDGHHVLKVRIPADREVHREGERVLGLPGEAPA